jgi:hypothetical protein
LALIKGPATDSMNWFISSDRQIEIGALFPGSGIVCCCQIPQDHRRHQHQDRTTEARHPEVAGGERTFGAGLHAGGAPGTTR